MMFKLSQFAPYRNAVVAKVNGDWPTARREFSKCIEAVRAAGGPPMIAGLLFRLGDVEAHAGNRVRAIELYEEALATDPGSPLALIDYAKSLADVLGESDQALQRLNEAEAMLTSGAWMPTEDDLTREQYESRIALLRIKIRRDLAPQK